MFSSVSPMYMYLYIHCMNLFLQCRYTYVSAFGKMVVETNDLAGQRELIAEYLQNEVMKPLQDLAKGTLSERKRLMNNGVELHRELKESMELLEKVTTPTNHTRVF